MDEGGESFPQDIQDAVSFVAHKSSDEMLEFWQQAIGELAERAYGRMPQLVQARSVLTSEECATKGKLHLPFLADLMKQHGMGGEDWLL